MNAPLTAPVAPQLARAAAELPRDAGWLYEPKLDGFRAIVFVDGRDHLTQSRTGKPLDRYFPELAFPPGHYVMDGELTIPDARGGEDFEALQERIHPAASRVARLAEERPARYVAFDLLAWAGRPLLDLPFAERRALLERELGKTLAVNEQVATAEQAERWLQEAEGVIAKRADAPYRPGERTGMVKVKRLRTIDCVVMGWRPGKQPGTVGSMILGLYDGDHLVPVGHTSAFNARTARELVQRLTPYETGELVDPGASRWSAGRDSAWRELRPELVAEVSFDHRSGRRIRHGAGFVRWREDKPPGESRIDQLDT
ncbi:MAG: ATP-dependent DNA ligase [Gaiellales bacterium]